MTYTNGEAAILTQIQACSGFSSGNVTRGIYNILNSGKAKTYAILRPNTFNNEQSALGSLGSTQYTVEWTTVCELFVKLDNYGESISELVDKRQEIITRFHQYRHAGDTTGTIEDVAVSSGSEVFELTNERTGTVWLRQDLFITWRENYYETLAE